MARAGEVRRDQTQRNAAKYAANLGLAQMWSLLLTQ